MKKKKKKVNPKEDAKKYYHLSTGYMMHNNQAKF